MLETSGQTTKLFKYLRSRKPAKKAVGLLDDKGETALLNKNRELQRS